METIYISNDRFGSDSYIGTREEFKKKISYNFRIWYEEYLARQDKKFIPFDTWIENVLDECLSVATDVDISNYEPIIDYLMNPHTGTVQTEEEWQDDFKTMSPEEWGGENFEDADLIYVVRNKDDEWEEK